MSCHDPARGASVTSRSVAGYRGYDFFGSQLHTGHPLSNTTSQVPSASRRQMELKVPNCRPSASKTGPLLRARAPRRHLHRLRPPGERRHRREQRAPALGNFRRLPASPSSGRRRPRRVRAARRTPPCRARRSSRRRRSRPRTPDWTAVRAGVDWADRRAGSTRPRTDNAVRIARRIEWLREGVWIPTRSGENRFPGHLARLGYRRRGSSDRSRCSRRNSPPQTRPAT
jgi:hypothetical protein